MKNFIYATLIKIFNKIQLSKEKKFFSIQPNKYCNKVKKNLELFILNKFFMTDIIPKQKLDIRLAKEENLINWNAFSLIKYLWSFRAINIAKSYQKKFCFY